MNNTIDKEFWDKLSAKYAGSSNKNELMAEALAVSSSNDPLYRRMIKTVAKYVMDMKDKEAVGLC